MKDLVVQLIELIERTPYPSSLVKTHEARVQADRAYDILMNYRGHPQILLDSLGVFVFSGCLPYALAGTANVLIDAAYLYQDKFDADGLAAATSYVQKTRAIDPENFYAEFAQARIYSRKYDYNLQRFSLNKISKMPEAEDNFYYARMESAYWKALKDKQKSRHWNKTAGDRAKTDTQKKLHQLDYGYALMEEGRLIEGIEALKRIEALCLDDPWYFVNIAGRYLEMEELDKAEYYVQRSLAIMDFGMARSIEAQIKERRTLSYQVKRFLFGKK